MGDKTGREACAAREEEEGPATVWALTHSTDVLPTTRAHHVGLFPPPFHSLLLLKCSLEAPAGSSCSSPLIWTSS